MHSYFKLLNDSIANAFSELTSKKPSDSKNVIIHLYGRQYK